MGRPRNLSHHRRFEEIDIGMPTATKAPPARVSLAPLPSLEDADLVRRARDGDERAFEEIVRRYRAPLIRYSARHVGRDHAEDVTQHALARAAAHLRDDPRPIHLRAWLYRVAHNAAINMRARKDFGHEELSLEIDGVPQPPELAAQRSEVREVVSELDRLPDRQRTALLLSVFEGMGYDEIASRLDTSPNSVRALLSRARVHLRKTAAAIAPLPLLQALGKKVSAVAGASGGSQGTLVAGGGLVQAKLVAVAATTVVAGATTAERAASNDGPGDGAGEAAIVQAASVAPAAAVPLDVDSLLPKAPPPEPPRAKPAPPPAEQPATPPPPVEPVPAEPVVPVSPIEAPAPVIEAPAPEAPAPEAPKDEEPMVEETFTSAPPPGNQPPPADGNNPPPTAGYVQP
jgi:RNA polymerase sigma factor (sigma-70 family)